MSRPERDPLSDWAAEKDFETPVGAPSIPIFATTRWTMVLNASDQNALGHDDALAQLCAIYWYPLYAFIRRQGASSHDAQDLTQEFFSRLLARNWLDRADRVKGKFRWYLLGALKHFLAHERDRAAAAKRGGGKIHIPLDEIVAEKHYQLEPGTRETPEKLFEHAWVMTLLARVREQLRERYETAGKRERFEKLECYLPGCREQRAYAEVALELGVSEGALRVELHRMKEIYRGLLRAEIAHTVSTPAEIDEELRHLLEVMQD